MKKILFLFLVFSLAPGPAELNAATYMQGSVASMHSAPCSKHAKDHNLCEQYVIRTDTMNYVIRQEEPKKVNLLPVGQEIYFRVDKNQMLVRGFTLNGKRIKDQKYIVVSEHQSSGMATPGEP